MRHPRRTSHGPLRDRSWLFGVAAMALAGSGVATQAATDADQAEQQAEASTTTTTIVCEQPKPRRSTTTTTTETSSGDPEQCPPETTTTTVPEPEPGSDSTAPSGPGTTDDGLTPSDGSAPPSDASSTAPATTTTVVPTTAPIPQTEVAAPDLPLAPPEDWPVRLISFPVGGPVTYYDDWGACRGGADCPRRHVGNDIIGRRLQPLLAAADGVVSHLVSNHRTAGWGLVIEDAEGWDYRYYHVNNDAPGTDDGSSPPEWRLAPGIANGSAVKAGQVVAYLGDSGNSELSVPHLHFEIHRPGGLAINPYPSLRFSEAMARCSVAAPGVLKESTLMPPINPALADAVVATSTGRGRFLLSLDGTVLAQGDAASVGWTRHAVDDPPCP